MSSFSSPDSARWREALEKCASEQIHLINQVQPAAVLLAVDQASGRIAHASANAGALFDDPERILGAPATDYLRAESLTQVERRVKSWTGRGPVAHEIETVRGTFHPGWVHEVAGHVVLEIPIRRRKTIGDWERHQEIEHAKRGLEESKSLEDCLERVAREVRALTDFDRVMIYQFRHDDSGEVVAEAVRDDWDPYLGLRYPAADIPPQARALFLRNATRVLVDVEAEPVPLVAQEGGSAAAPLDLSLSRYRQPAAVHVEYLKNMKVRGSLVSSIVLHGKLWGLVSCHHGEPVDLGVEVQVRTAALLEHFSAHLALLVRQDELEQNLEHARLANKVIQSITVTDEWVPSVVGMGEELLKSMEADGLVVRFEGKTSTMGSVPPQEVVDLVCRRFFEEESDSVVATDDMVDYFGLDHEGASLRGVLAAKLSRFQDDALLFFRREEVSKVRWGGEPGKGLVLEGGSARLQPRASFEEWVETVKGHSAPWQRRHRILAEELATTLIDIVITAYFLRRELIGDEMTRLRLSHESSRDPVMLADARGSLVYANPAADRWLGRRFDSIEDILVSVALRGEVTGEALLHQLVVEGSPLSAVVRLKHGTAEAERRLDIGALDEGGRRIGFVVHLHGLGEDPDGGSGS